MRTFLVGKKAGTISLAAGLILILAYWYALHPMDFARGYTEDWCQPEITRQLVAEALSNGGIGANFHPAAYLAPAGMSLPFMPWGIEISWLGGYFWKWSRDFPFLWMQFGLSLVASYLGVGFILRKMKLGPVAAWGLALTVVGFHVARHFKIWHHYEHVLEHWVYWSFFLDAWIWQRFYRERRWSLSLEAWRGLCLLGMMTTAGYFWGPLILEWVLVRLCMMGMAALWSVRRRRSHLSAVPEVMPAIVIDGTWGQAAPALALGLFFVVIDFRWFLPLLREARLLGTVSQGLGWYARWVGLFRPLWLDDLVSAMGGIGSIERFTAPETVIAAGWFLWIPLLLGFWRVGASHPLGKPRSSRILTVLPFLILLLVAAVYINQNPPRVARAIQKVIPFMTFFRVAARWGLFMPQMLGVILALCWPELSTWVRGLLASRPRQAWAMIAVFSLSSGFEIAQMRAPVTTMPKLSDSAAHLLEGVRQAPGTTVLDLPFCLAAGNGVCTEEQCPNYPESTTGGCFRGWHEKNVYGIYASRLVASQCETYHRAPYLSWFDAWKTQRCFSAPEWTDFCGYLDAHTELSAILLYPDIWQGAGQPACMAEFARHLGQPIEQAEFVVHALKGKQSPQFSRLLRFGPRCVPGIGGTGR